MGKKKTFLNEQEKANGIFLANVFVPEVWKGPFVDNVLSKSFFTEKSDEMAEFIEPLFSFKIPWINIGMDDECGYWRIAFYWKWKSFGKKKVLRQTYKWEVNEKGLKISIPKIGDLK
jgi:hypothetical protein